jgi:hypothetical protein
MEKTTKSSTSITARRVLKCLVPLAVVILMESCLNPILSLDDTSRSQFDVKEGMIPNSVAGLKDDTRASIQQQLPFPIPAPGFETAAGTCLCEGNGGDTDDNTENGQSFRMVRCMPKFHVIGVHKAGSKAIMNYLKHHPGLAGTRFIEDRGRWLTNEMPKTFVQQCHQDRQKEESQQVLLASTTTTTTTTHTLFSPPRRPMFVPNGKKNSNPETVRAVSTCSFEDYTRLYGQYSGANDRTCQKNSKSSSNDDNNQQYNINTSIDHHRPVGLDRPMFDELVIWEMTWSKPFGTSLTLPQLFHLLQPSGHLLITVRDSIDVTYSAYNHFGARLYGKDVQGPLHFDHLMRKVVQLWTDRHCTLLTLGDCLPQELVLPGRWLSRSMYSKNIPAWLESFGCAQVHLFDVSMDPLTAVAGLYEVMGVPNQDVAQSATACTYQLQNDEAANETRIKEGRNGGRPRRLRNDDNKSNVCNEGERSKNFINKAAYEPMLSTTRSFLEDFFASYYAELCGLMTQYPCLAVPLFLQHCTSTQHPG